MPQGKSTERRIIGLAKVLPGAQPFKNANINDTFHGQILTRSDGVRSAIIKDIEPKELANEVIVATLATVAGLPVPQAHLAIVEQNEIPAQKGPRIGNDQRLVYASEDAQTPPVAQLYVGQDADAQERVKRRLSEWSGLGDLYGLDTWVANVDRHAKNLLFNGDREVWLIDHGHCFGGRRWTPSSLKPANNYQNKLASWLTPSLNEDKREAVASIAIVFTTHYDSIDLENLIHINHALRLLARSDFDAVVDFLRNRRQYVAKFSAAALNVARLA